MKVYHGILVDKSLINQNVISNLKVIGKKKSGSWTLIKIEIEEKHLDKVIKLLQKYMSDDKFYFHIYGNDDLIAVFKDKVLKFDPQNPRAADDAQFEHFVSAKDWFAFNTVYGTSEEKAFVRMLDRQMQKLQTQYEQIYLLRNEGHFAIYNYADGQAFQPDFVLFLRENSGELLIY